jgi:hypothetical protein
MIFFLGTHEVHWLADARFAHVPLFISRHRLAARKTLPRAVGTWALDSGGFTELQMHGAWTLSPAAYVAEVRRYRDEVGGLCWAAPQDWMCEPIVIAGGRGPHGVRFAGTKLSVREHIRRTVENFVELRSLAPEIPFIPVLQGWTHTDYLDCAELYERERVDLRAEPVVGVGTMCRRQATLRASVILHDLASDGYRLHAFGFNMGGLRDVGGILASADSTAWSERWRHEPPLPGHTHKHCNNCPEAALLWYTHLAEALADPEMRVPEGGVSAVGTVELSPAKRAWATRRARRLATPARASAAVLPARRATVARRAKSTVPASAAEATPTVHSAAVPRLTAMAKQLTLGLFPTPARSPLVISCGLGVDSVSMLTGMKARGIVPDLILFADPGDEKPETYAYLPILQNWLAANGFPPVTVVRRGTVHGELGDYSTLYENCIVNHTLPSAAFGKGGCTAKWKIEVMDGFVDAWTPAIEARAAGMLVLRAIGYDAGPKDSKRRWDILDTERYEYVYFLRAWGWDRDRCVQEIVAAGLPVPPKSACFFCPATTPAELADLVFRHPELADRILEMERVAKPYLRNFPGLWRHEIKGMRGAVAHPGSMTEFIADLRAHPEKRVRYLPIVKGPVP